MGEPGTLYAAQAGVASIDHATQLSDETMRLMREKHIPAVPTFTIFEYFAAARRIVRQPRLRASRPCSTTRLPNSRSRSPPASPSPWAPT
jgi:imidazolonepropionase-like amidohydrolase